MAFLTDSEEKRRKGHRKIKIPTLTILGKSNIDLVKEHTAVYPQNLWQLAMKTTNSSYFHWLSKKEKFTY